jgi:hypothetical protein
MFLHGVGMSGDSVTLKPDQIDLALKYGLVGWNRFEDAKGNAVEFSAKAMRQIAGPDRIELAMEIINLSHIGEEARKNS